MRDALAEYRKLIAGLVLKRIALRGLGIAGLFLLSSWFAMVVEGAIARELGVTTMSFAMSVAAVGALWVLIAPLIWLALRLYVPPEPSPWPDRR